jgi:3-oxoacyl-[acyl-carrier-protein] synthase-3
VAWYALNQCYSVLNEHLAGRGENKNMPATITGWGHCVPPAIMTNDDIATFLDTNDDWIVERTGIRERRVSHVGSGELGKVAALRALAAAGKAPDDVDAIIFASVSPELLVPSTASIVQKRLGIEDVAAMDLNVGCSGFVYGLAVANGLISTGVAGCVLLVAAERLTWYLDWTDRNTGVLFGDGSGAVVMEAGSDDEGVLAADLGNDGAASGALMVDNFGTAIDRLDHDMLELKFNFDGREIFRRATKGMARSAHAVLERTGCAMDDVDLVIPHQANLRIIQAVGHKLGVGDDKVYVNVNRYGNTSASSIPIALSEALSEGRISAGDLILMPAFGAGLSRGAALLRWGGRVTPLATSDAELPASDATALDILRPVAEAQIARARA